LIAGLDDGNNSTVSEYYSPGHIFRSATGAPQRTGVGYYDPPDPNASGHSHDKWWKKDYEGDGIIVRNYVPTGGPVVGASTNIIERDDYRGSDLEFCLEYESHQQVNLGHNRIFITTNLVTNAVTAQILNNDVPPLVMDPASFGLTQLQLDTFAAQVRSEYDSGVPEYKVTMMGTVVSSNKYKNVLSTHKENQSVFDSSSADGEFNIQPDISYMKDMVNLERETFTVRKAAVYEFE